MGSETSASVAGCFRTWSYLHNESVNILSHAVGFVVFVGLFVALWTASWPWPSDAVGTTTTATTTATTATNQAGDRAAVATYLAGVAVCFALSALFHTLLAHHAPRCAAAGMALDVAGVLVLMAGATVAKFPEKWHPRRFDLFGASHQIMHVMVLVAAVVFAVGTARSLAFRRTDGAVCRNNGF
ncbi:Hly-III-related protein [Niveomyces insectorum RCEF 264]|uniref:Hly-III-related protein n=1 Tax=Niveomyces insectorum RCEF 264 TaxID=1081102 RepID=A0A167QW39_9HYPO|nr:Hly-III-related protein [Niveomyces insectorum RCEF 264]